MDIKNFDFSKFVEAVQNEITMVSATVKEKTLARFARPIGICAFTVFGAFTFVYAPPAKKLSLIQRRIDAARITAQYADSYKDLHDQLAASYSRLPDPKDKEHWLTDTFLGALRDEGLIADSIVPPEEEVVHGFVVQRVRVSMSAKFSEIYSLVRRLESLKPAVHVLSVEVDKTAKLEINTVSCTVGTMIPVKKAE